MALFFTDRACFARAEISALLLVAQAVMRVFALALDPAGQRATGPVGSLINGSIKVCPGVFDHEIGAAGRRDLNMAALVLAATRAVKVGEADGDVADMVLGPIEGKAQTPFNVLAQAAAKFKTPGLDDDLHIKAPVE